MLIVTCRKSTSGLPGEDASALAYASTELRGDRELVLEVFESAKFKDIHKEYSPLGHVAGDLRADRHVVLAAVLRNVG